MLHIKRVYDPPAKADGVRFLVERLWPRGVKKDNLKIDRWIKDVAPSTALRKWFGHDASKWEKFRQRYWVELDERTETWQPIVETARKNDVTLLFSSHDTEHNNVVALKEYLENRLQEKSR